MKRVPLILLLFLLLSVCVPAAAEAADAVDYVLYTDVVAKIDGHPICSYNIGGRIAVSVEDLAGYGFRVAKSANTLRITRVPAGEQISWPDYTPKTYDDHPLGSRAAPVYASDKKVYADGRRVKSFCLGDKTLIWFNDLARFGAMHWDAAARVSGLTLAPAPQLLSPAPDPSNPASFSNSRLYILMYHEMIHWDADEIGNWSTTTNKFRQDLQWLKDNGYTTYLPCELAAGVPLAERAVMITFDDGYASNYTLAYPLLKEFGMKASICLIGDCIGQSDEYLTWDMCREMADSGLIEFGSHTYGLHESGIRRLSGESRASYEQRLSADIERSVDELRRELGRDVVFFAYPHGRTEPWANAILEKYFCVSVTTNGGVANISKGLFDLPRYNVNSVMPARKFLPDGPKQGT